MNAAKLATSALTALALFAAAGCGGDDDPGGGALTQAEYQKQGNALCRDAISEAKDVEVPTSPDEIPDYVDRLFDVSFGYTEEFEALEPPEELQEAHDESVRLTDDSKRLTDELVERLRDAENPQAAVLREFRKLAETENFKRSQEVTRELGLDDCLDVGAPGAEPEAS